MAEKKTTRPPAAPKQKAAPKLKADQPRHGSARVHTAEVDLATAVKMQAAGYRGERKTPTRAIMFGDLAAFEAWRGMKNG